MRLIPIVIVLAVMAAPALTQERRAAFTLGGQGYAIDAGPGFCRAEAEELERWALWPRMMAGTERRFEPRAVFLDCVALNAIRAGAQPENFAMRLAGTLLGGGEPLPARQSARVQFDMFRGMFRMMQDRPGSVTGVPVEEIVQGAAEERGLIVECVHPRASAGSVGLDICLAEPDGSDPMQGGLAVRPVGERFLAVAALGRPGMADGPGFDEAETMLEGLSPLE
ncbi:MAG: hypothetical protein TEF_01760 [Rhizobiales bacterium NRL2]|jgi:hypothetical protein|nr:MAG: hypothetical protein TEF_01760 [Rhizobiales bacterium NRL2]